MTWALHQGDCLEILPQLDDNSIDAVVTDPPYELGFMGKAWDASGIAYNCQVWQECLRVLKPGGHLLAFGGSRTYHRLAVAVEDAGFEIRDQIMWVYGSGFPKSQAIGKAIDKAAGVEREVIGENIGFGDKKSYAVNPTKGGSAWHLGYDGKGMLTAPATPEARRWDGWGTALKPSHEPIVMARKPFKGTVAGNVLGWGTGGINIDGCRVEYENDNDLNIVNAKATKDLDKRIKYGKKKDDICYGKYDDELQYSRPATPQGRFPANLIHDGSEEVKALFPETVSGGGDKANREFSENRSMSGGNYPRERGIVSVANSGSAARFFKSTPAEERDYACLYYCAKAGKKERNLGCAGLEEKTGKRTQSGGDDTRGRPTPINRNTHPTVKPLALMKYLVRLITPPGGTVLDPFAGSGTTIMAAVEEGFDSVGIELEPEYVEIAECRIRAVEQVQQQLGLF